MASDHVIQWSAYLSMARVHMILWLPHHKRRREPCGVVTLFSSDLTERRLVSCHVMIWSADPTWLYDQVISREGEWQEVPCFCINLEEGGWRSGRGPPAPDGRASPGSTCSHVTQIKASPHIFKLYFQYKGTVSQAQNGPKAMVGKRDTFCGFGSSKELWDNRWIHFDMLFAKNLYKEK